MSRSAKPATTQSVLEAFVFVRSDKNKAIRLFYEWLAQHDAEVAKATEERIIKLLEIGGPIEQIICDYWGDPEFDKDDALVLIEKAIKGEK